MLGLGTGFYGVGGETYFGGEWFPSDESSLEAWWRNKVGITLKSGTENVSQWADQSGNGHHMLQADTGEQPAYNITTGALTFDPTSDTQNLALLDGPGATYDPTSIELGGTFVIGIKMNPAAVSTVPLGSNADPSEMIKIQTSSTIRLKNDSSGNKDFTLDSGATTDDSYWVIARDSGGDTTLHKDGVANPSSAISVPGTFDIDAIGVRRTDLNPFNGTIKEIVIFKNVEDEDFHDLVANINDRLSGL